MSPSLRHQFLAWAVPRVRKSRDLDDVETERARIERWHAGLDRSLPTRLVPRFAKRFSVVEEETGGFPTYVLTPRHIEPTRTIFFAHGGGYMAPIDPFHVRYAARLALALDARVVLPDYPLAPEHTWRDSFDPMTDLAERWAKEPGGLVFVGDSAGGGYALALAVALRDRGGPQATHLLLHAPWVDLTTSTPETVDVAAIDPWLFIGKLHAYAEWWAGSAEDLGRPEVSPALADLVRSAADADVLRDPRHPGARLSPARTSRGRGRLATDLRGGAGPDPRVRDAAVHPRGSEGLAPDPGVPRMIISAEPFDTLDVRAAYDVWRLRQAVFVVEQACPYPDLDGRDLEPGTRHVLLRDDESLMGYARVLDDGDVWRIGRVVLTVEARGRGLADPLMQAALDVCPGRDIVLDAQSPLAGWYERLGFDVSGPEFLEDGIPHVPMRRAANFTG